MNHLTATGNHMPYWTTQCYRPPGSSDFPTFTSAKAATQPCSPKECKAELAWVVVISQDSLPTKDSHISQKKPGSVMARNQSQVQRSN